jgi:hypothetical protein
MKRPILLTIVAAWMIAAGMLGLLLFANALGPGSPLDLHGPPAAGLSALGSGLFVYAGFELLRLRRVGLYAMLLAASTRLILACTYERTFVVWFAALMFGAWIAVVVFYRSRLN